MSNLLSIGVIQSIFNASNQKPEKPVLQIAKIIQGDCTLSIPQKYKVDFNDGREIAEGIILTNSIRKLNNNNIEKGQLLKLIHYNCIIKSSTENQEIQKVIIVTKYEIASNKLYPIFSNLSQLTSFKCLSSYDKSLKQLDSESNVGENTSNITHEEFLPISSLRPHHIDWKIQVVAGTKSQIRYWQNERGSGKWFTVILYDDSGEIRARAFGEQVDKFYNKIQMGKVYVISKAIVSCVTKHYWTIKNNYEISIENHTIIKEVINKNPYDFMKFNFVTIVDLIEYEPDDIIDVLGLVIDVSDISEIIFKAKNKSNAKIRHLTIVDKSKYHIVLTLWGLQAEQFDKSYLNKIIACKNVRVSDYKGGHGRTLTTGIESTLFVDPKTQDATELRDWYELHGSHSKSIINFTAQYLDDIKTLEQIKYEIRNNKIEQFLMMATILYIKSDPISYPACPFCKKKVIEGDFGWQCEKCSLSCYEPEYRYYLTVSVADFTADLPFKSFNDTAVKIMECDVKELIRLEGENKNFYNSCFERACLKQYLIKCRVNPKDYKGKGYKVQCNAISLVSIDPVVRAKKIYEIIGEMEDNLLS